MSCIPAWLIIAAAAGLAIVIALAAIAVILAGARARAIAADDALLEAMSADGIPRETSMSVLARFRQAEGA